MSLGKEQEAHLKEVYGKVPTRAEILRNQLKQRKYFDSGDYAMSKAGKKPDSEDIGSEHPVPENIPHSPLLSTGNSPVRRPSSLSIVSATLGSELAEKAQNSDNEHVISDK